MNEALAGFWWFEDLSLLMDRGGHVLWAILVLSTVLWMILLTGARRLKDAEIFRFPSPQMGGAFHEFEREKNVILICISGSRNPAVHWLA